MTLDRVARNVGIIFASVLGLGGLGICYLAWNVTTPPPPKATTTTTVPAMCPAPATLT